MLESKGRASFRSVAQSENGRVKSVSTIKKEEQKKSTELGIIEINVGLASPRVD